MKTTLIALSSLILLSACGDSGIQNPLEKKEEVKVISKFIGEWKDADDNKLSLKQDGTAKSNDDALLYKVNEFDQILFSSNDVQADLCNYEVKTEGGLDELLVKLNLKCEVAGDLTYTLVNQ